jgi:PilZ domain-containing protein
MFQRRRAPRLVANVKVSYTGSAGPASATTLDLSMSGLFLQIAEPPEAGQWLELEFQVSLGGERRPVHCRGQVARVLGREQAQSYGLLPGAAVEFRKFEQGLEELRAFLAERLELRVEDLGEPVFGKEREAPTEPAPQRSPAPEPPPHPPQKRAAQDRPRSVESFEPPPKVTPTRLVSRAARAPSVEQTPGAEWTRRDWERYFEGLRRGALSARQARAAARGARPEWKPLGRLLLLAASITLAGFVVLRVVLWLLFRG